MPVIPSTVERFIHDDHPCFPHSDARAPGRREKGFPRGRHRGGCPGWGTSTASPSFGDLAKTKIWTGGDPVAGRGRGQGRRVMKTRFLIINMAGSAWFPSAPLWFVPGLFGQGFAKAGGKALLGPRGDK